MDATSKICAILILILLFSCKDDSIKTQNLSSDKYVPGYAILLATSNSKIGILKVDTEKHDLKGVIYFHDESNDFNVFDDIFFRIKEENNLQIAYDIKNQVNQEAQIRGAELRNITAILGMNLHNAVVDQFTHPEYNLHRLSHLNDDDNSKSKISNYDSMPDNINVHNDTYYKMIICDLNGENCDPVYIRPSDQTKYDNLESRENGVYFQIDQTIINGQEFTIIIGITDEHKHFGDRESF